MSEEHKFYTIQKNQNDEYIIVELENENDQKGKQVGRNYWFLEVLAIRALERKAQLNNWIAVWKEKRNQVVRKKIRTNINISVFS